MPSVIYSGEPMNGTAAGELIIDVPGFDGPNSTINGNDGNDLILGDGDHLIFNYLASSNTSLATAVNIDASGNWSNSANNPIIDTAGPHTSIYIEPDAGQQRFFAVTIGANETIRLDVDFTNGTAWGNTDTIVDILDGDGNLLATNDDNAGDFGSIGSFDSRLSFTPTVAGTYYIRVREFGSADGNVFEGGEQIFLNVSVSNHAFGAGTITSGNDTINGGLGDDTIFGMLGTDTVHGNEGNDIIVSTGSGSYFGDEGNDTIIAGIGSPETLDGGDGIDLLDTTRWSGTYVIDLATGVTNYGGESFVNFENLRAGAGSDTLTGTATANIIHGGDGNDEINGLGGNDQLFGEAGNDTLNGGEGGDTLNGGGGVDTINGENGNDNVIISFANGAAADGGAGTDTLTMSILAASATISLDGVSSQGADTMTTEGFENLDAGSSTGDVTVNGTIGANTITTGSGNDTIRGVFGADIIFTGAGDDLLSAFSGNFALDGGDGIDAYNGAVYGSSGTHYWSLDLGYHGSSSFADPVTGTLTNIENFIGMQSANEHVRGTGSANSIWAGDGDDHLFGLGGADIMFGGTGNDVLNGGAGSDTMDGDAGNDTYIVDDAGDQTVEALGGGTDTVRAWISWALADDVERLQLLGGANNSATGNGLDNELFGNAGNNALNGSVGADRMEGFAGNDTYIVDNAGDQTVEAIGGGTDTVRSWISWTLADNVERLQLLGGANNSATGNALDNELFGNAGNNVLNGRAGVDRMEGFAGNDSYFVDDAGDQTIEAVGGGTDTARAWISWSLGANVERLVLLGTTQALNGAGNTLDNEIFGNAGNNRLAGLAGNDTLTGGAGLDTFIFNTPLNAATNVDTITDFSVADDTIRLDDAIFTAAGPIGTLAAAAFTIGAAATTAAHRIVYNSATGALIYDSNGSAAGGATQFAILDTGLALTNADFLIA